MLLDEPFRGVDIGARREITRKVRSLAKDGGAPIVFSADIDEILEIADRIIVLVDGSVRLDRYTTETNRDEIVRRMSEVM
jgi:simple sugar transport system ATP-binding protein